MITDGIKSLAPTAALLFFAIIFFGIMIDVGLFDPLVKLILRMVRDDPMRLVVGTAVLAMVVSLDGDGSTTFIIVTSALLPLYLKLGVSPRRSDGDRRPVQRDDEHHSVGRPDRPGRERAGDSRPSDVFVPMVPSLIVGLIMVLGFAIHLGIMERRRIGTLVLTSERILEKVGNGGSSSTGSAGTGGSNDSEDDGGDTGRFIDGLDPKRDTLRPKLLWFNACADDDPSRRTRDGHPAHPGAVHDRVVDRPRGELPGGQGSG